MKFNVSKIHIMVSIDFLQKLYIAKSSESMDVGSFILLFRLAKDIDSLSMEEIKLLLNISNTKLKKIITQLKSKKYIEIANCRDDSRRKLVSVSIEGEKYINNISKKN